MKRNRRSCITWSIWRLDSAYQRGRRSAPSTREKLQELHEDAQRYTGPFELPEPAEEGVSWVRRIVERELVN